MRSPRRPGRWVTLGNDDPERTKKSLRGRARCLFARLFRSRAEQERRHMVAEAEHRPGVLRALLPRPLGTGGRARFRVLRPHRRALVTPLLRGSRRAPLSAARRLRAAARLVAVFAQLVPRVLVVVLRRRRRRAPLGVARFVPAFARLPPRLLAPVAAAGRGALAARAPL